MEIAIVPSDCMWYQWYMILFRVVLILITSNSSIEPIECIRIIPIHLAIIQCSISIWHCWSRSRAEIFFDCSRGPRPKLSVPLYVIVLSEGYATVISDVGNIIILSDIRTIEVPAIQSVVVVFVWWIGMEHG